MTLSNLFSGRFSPHGVKLFGILCAMVLIIAPAQAQQTRVVSGHVLPVTTQLKSIGRFAAETNLYLTIGLPLHDKEGLTNLIRTLSDPASTNFHEWLTPEQFTQRFGPTQDDYQKVVSFAQKHGLKVVGTHRNRVVLDVSAPVANVEEAFQIHLMSYLHPTENRTFYAPDAEPTVDADVPILHIGNLENYNVPRPLLKLKSNTSTNQITAYATGSGPGGDFTGHDFRAAYAPGVTNTGAGQYIAIVDVGGPYYTNDIYCYETNAGFSTSIVISNVLLSGWTGIPVGTNMDDGEETLDIDMSMSMAPGATILNYEGSGDDVFNQIATDNLAKQITMSYGFGIDPTIEQDYLQFAAQGQTFFQASGDGGADLPGGTGFTGEPYSTIVGGTSLTTSSAGGPWSSEAAWGGSGGGSSGYGIPYWQQGINMSTNQGSTSHRNYPDVAMLADVVIWWYFENGVGATVGGTSASSPQWAGFMALVNQSAATQGKHSVGYLNPVIYGIGKGTYSTYAGIFHDITTGNNFNSHNPTKYPAIAGYDLATGWGSPQGQSTINALLGTGTNDFSILSYTDGLTITQGGTGTALLQVSRKNGYAGTVSLALSGVPTGVATSFTPSSSTTNTAVLTYTTGSSANTTTSNVTVTATSGSLVHSLTNTITIVPPIPGQTQVSLASYFNLHGIYTDGTTFSTSIDGDGNAYSGTLMGAHPNLRNVLFNLGSFTGNNVITCSGQTITLPATNCTTLLIFGTAVDGNQANQSLTITYSDNSTTVVTQSFSDWFTPQNYAGETTIPYWYRNTSGGTPNNEIFNAYVYSLTLNETKAVKSIKLPSNSDVKIMAMTLVDAPASASLASYYNRAGMYTDGTIFTNSPSNGMDGSGSAYSATLLGGSQVWNGVQFDFGPANATNVISCSNEIISLPTGNFTQLKMLATGVQGGQASQSFTVTYSDNSTTTFTQSLSDWYTPANYAGESNVVLMGYRNLSGGTMDNRTFYLYGYSFNLNASKTTKSFTLPNNGNVIVTAISLVPDVAPIFLANPFTEPSVNAGTAYSGTIATNAYDYNSNTMTFTKVSGPTWLSVAGGGALSGTPLSPNDGNNSFVVSVSDPGGFSNTATMNLNVIAAPPINAGVSISGTNLQIGWSGGISPYQVQVSYDLINWTNVGTSMSSSNLLIAPTNAQAFYRILGN